MRLLFSLLCFNVPDPGWMRAQQEATRVGDCKLYFDDKSPLDIHYHSSLECQTWGRGCCSS